MTLKITLQVAKNKQLDSTLNKTLMLMLEILAKDFKKELENFIDQNKDVDQKILDEFIGLKSLLINDNGFLNFELLSTYQRIRNKKMIISRNIEVLKLEKSSHLIGACYLDLYYQSIIALYHNHCFAFDYLMSFEPIIEKGVDLNTMVKNLLALKPKKLFYWEIGFEEKTELTNEANMVLSD